MPFPFIRAAQAHEKWFVDASRLPHQAPEFYRSLNGWTAGGVVAILGAIALGRSVQSRLVGSTLAFRAEKIRRQVRRQAVSAVAVTMAVFLLWSAAHGNILADNYSAPATATGAIALVVEAVLAVLLFLGWMMPVAAIGLAGLYLSLFFMFPAIEPIDYLHVAGVAVFLFSTSSGRFSPSWFAGKKGIPSIAWQRVGYDGLRIFTGLALLWLALAKWLRPELHFALLDIYSTWNPLAILHMIDFSWLTREIYVFMLAVSESIFALFILSKTLTRLTAAFLMPMFLVSTVFLGAEEIIGHLPIIGVLFAIAVADDGTS